MGKVPDECVILQQLPTDVERDVLAIDDTTKESHPLGNDAGRIVLNQHFSTVKGNPRVCGGVLGHLEQRRSLLVDVEHAEEEKVEVVGGGEFGD